MRNATFDASGFKLCVMLAPNLKFSNMGVELNHVGCELSVNCMVYVSDYSNTVIIIING